jgi:hypothetical protein
LDAYEMHNGGSVADLLLLLQKRGEEYDDKVFTVRTAPARHVLFDTAETIRRWRTSVMEFDHKDPHSVERCINPIRDEQTWEWLYLLTIAYGDTDDFISRIWQLHDLISAGLSKDTLALSNLISLLTYWGKYSRRPLQYIHCNLRGVYFKDLSQLEFYGSDLTQAKTPEDTKLQDTRFICCLFDKETLLWLQGKEECCLAAPCYVEQSSEGDFVKQVAEPDESCH